MSSAIQSAPLAPSSIETAAAGPLSPGDTIQPTNTEATAALEPPAAAPLLKFPPFPSVEGLTIISFEDFQPGGIILPAVPDDAPAVEEDEEAEDAVADEPEVDAAGVPTVQLSTTHEPFAVPEPADGAAKDKAKVVKVDPMATAMMAAHKRRRNKAKKMDLQALGITAAKGEGRRLTWWEKWELEELKKGAQGVKYDVGEDRMDRLDLATKTFKRGHSLEPGVQSIWDKFLDFIGMLRQENQMQQPGSNKHKKQSRGITRRRDEDDSSDDDVDEPEPKNIEEQWAERVARFTERPMDALKLFFSSHYHEEGMYWSDAKLRDGPIIVSLFIRYLLQEKVLPEYAKSLTEAYMFLEETIKHDLVATRAFSMGAEDDFSQACVNDLGTMVLQDGYGRWVPAKEVLEAQAIRDKMLLAEREKVRKEREEERKRMEEERAKNALQDEGPAWGSGKDWSDIPGGWGAPIGWGDSGGWGDAANEDDPAVDAQWSTYHKPTLAPLSTALTHTLLRTEWSIRKIVDVRPPEPSSADILRQKYATVVFEPWPVPEEVGERSILCQPQMLAEATGEKELALMSRPGGSHTVQDRIELLVEPEHAARARKGLGVYAIWVQAGKVNDLPEEATVRPMESSTENAVDPAPAPVTPVKTTKSYASVVKPAVPSLAPIEMEVEEKGPKAETFWFFQHVTIVVPSYWTE